jgi:predicted regulator of Ras-like GTPase activity (Roadblock/LC7/MglB family)
MLSTVDKGGVNMDAVLQRLTDLDEILNAVLVGKDGLIVAGIMKSDNEEMVGALSAAAFGSITSFTNQVNTGDIRHIIIETKTGTIQMEEAGDLILIVITRGTGNLGRIRFEMKKVCRQVSQLVANY